MLPSHGWKREDKLREPEGFRHGLRGERPDQNWDGDEVERAVEVLTFVGTNEGGVGMGVDVEVKHGGWKIEDGKVKGLGI